MKTITTYGIEVRTTDRWTTHSIDLSYRDAIDQADMMGGRVRLSTGLLDTEAHKYAVRACGCELSYDEWSAQDDDERAEWESAANPSGNDEATGDDSADLLNDEIDVADLRGEFLGEYGRHGGAGPVVMVYAPNHCADKVRKLWAKLDECDDAIEEDRIFDHLERLGAVERE